MKLGNYESREVKNIIAAVEELRDYMRVSDVKARENESRINAILEALLRFTVRDLSRKIEVGELGDDLDAIAVGINTMAEELEEHIRVETQSAERFRDQNKKLERVNKELSSFAYVSSHDLQEPLRKINTYISRIVDEETEPLPQQIKFYLERIRSSASRMQTLIKDILEYSKLSNPDAETKDCDLTMLARDCRKDFEELLQEQGASFSFADLGKVMVVPFQLKRVLNNLISNSFKFRDKERPLQIILRCRIEIGTETGNPELSAVRKYCHLTYSDNGIGFDPVYNQKIFEVFQRLHNNESDYKGTGVGLAICKRIIENHGGAMAAAGEPGKGASFHIFLPA